MPPIWHLQPLEGRWHGQGHSLCGVCPRKTLGFLLPWVSQRLVSGRKWDVAQGWPLGPGNAGYRNGQEWPKLTVHQAPSSRAQAAVGADTFSQPALLETRLAWQSRRACFVLPAFLIPRTLFFSQL